MHLQPGTGLKSRRISFFKETVFGDRMPLICAAIPHGCDASWQPTPKYLMSEAPSILEPSNEFAVLKKVFENCPCLQLQEGNIQSCGLNNF